MHKISHDEIFSLRPHRSTLILFFALAVYSGICTAEPAASKDKDTLNTTTVHEVDCLLPSQLRSLGEESPRLAPRRQVSIAAEECEKRGGEIINTHEKGHQQQ